MRIEKYSSNIVPDVSAGKAYANSREYQDPVLKSNTGATIGEAASSIVDTIQTVVDKTKEIDEKNKSTEYQLEYKNKYNNIMIDLTKNESYDSMDSEQLITEYNNRTTKINDELGNRYNTLPQKYQEEIALFKKELDNDAMYDLKINALDRAKNRNLGLLKTTINTNGKLYAQTGDVKYLKDTTKAITDAEKIGTITHDQAVEYHTTAMSSYTTNFYNSLEQTHPEQLEGILTTMKKIIDPEMSEEERKTAMEALPGFGDIETATQNSIINSLENALQQKKAKEESDNEEQAYKTLYNNKLNITGGEITDDVIKSVENPNNDKENFGRELKGNERDNVLSRLDRIKSRQKEEESQEAQDILSELGTSVDRAASIEDLDKLREKINNSKKLTNSNKNVLRSAVTKRTKELKTTDPDTYMSIKQDVISKLRAGESVDYMSDIAPYVGDGISTKDELYFRNLINDGINEQVEKAKSYGQKELKDDYDRHNISDRSATVQYQFEKALDYAIEQEKKNDPNFDMKKALDADDENSVLCQVLAQYKLTGEKVVEYLTEQSEIDAETDLYDIISFRVNKLNETLQDNPLVYEATKNVYNTNKKNVNDTTVGAEIKRLEGLSALKEDPRYNDAVEYLKKQGISKPTAAQIQQLFDKYDNQ